MQNSDDDDFAIKPGVPRARRGGRGKSFIARVLRETGAGGQLSTHSPTRRGAILGRGHIAAQFAGRSLNAKARRVVIKTRLVNLKRVNPRSTATHLRYIERDSVGPQRESGRAYAALCDDVDLKDFAQRCNGDRHQFRFIVAPEDGVAIANLQRFTRDLMCHVERDLGVELDWIAIDHWDTDNPHTHIVLRGKDVGGRALIIARDYIAHGMRQRACELATDWLGPRTELEIQTSRLREIEQPRWTGLDHVLQHEANDNEIHLDRMSKGAYAQQQLLRGRLQHLTAMGLAQPLAKDHWKLHADFEATLRTLGERGDIVRTLQRAMRDTQREFAIFDAGRAVESVVGCVVGKGLADELSERRYLIVDGLDGRSHYVALSVNSDLDLLPLGAVVEVRGGSRGIDRAIAAAATNGVYRTEDIRSSLQAQGHRDVDKIMTWQVRRLEVLRRAGLVERSTEGVWRIPHDLPERGNAFDARRLDGATVTLRCALPIDQQIRVIGATWLDQQLVADPIPATGHGFGADVRKALSQRTEFLMEQGLAYRSNQRVILARNLLSTLRERDIDQAAQAIRKATGLAHRPVGDGTQVTGIYRRSVQLASGRFALLEEGLGFSLVPWRPVAEQRLGQRVSVTITGTTASWELGRQRGLEIG